MLQLSSTDGIRAEEDKTTSKVVLSWAEGASATLRFASVFGKLHQREGDFQKKSQLAAAMLVEALGGSIDSTR